MIPAKLFHDAIWHHYNKHLDDHPNGLTVEALKVKMLTEDVMLAEMPIGFPHCLVIRKTDSMGVARFEVNDEVPLPASW